MRHVKINDSTTKIWDLYREGYKVTEISRMMNLSYPMVSSAVGRGRRAGILEPKSSYTLPYLLQINSLQVGRLKKDIINKLSQRQQNWLVNKSVDLGCESLAEYIVEVLRDEYEKDRASS